MIDQVLKNQCIIALDTQNESKLDTLLNALEGTFTWVKVGMELYYQLGPSILNKLKSKNFKIFLDLKLYDIPQTVHNAILSLSNYPFDMLTLHLQGGNIMLQAAHDALSKKKHPAKLLGVSVLTSFSEEDWQNTQASPTSIKESVNKMVCLKNNLHLYGVVCSSFEIEDVKKLTQLKTIVPGIRWSATANDQVRVKTPSEALTRGADYLVIGREITAATDIHKAIISLKGHLHEQYLK